MLGLAVGTVRNNMNWVKGIKINKSNIGENTTIYLVEKGTCVRTNTISSQLAPKDLYPKVKLTNRTLYDLIPGRIHAIYANTLEDFGNYDSQREL